MNKFKTLITLTLVFNTTINAQDKVATANKGLVDLVNKLSKKIDELEKHKWTNISQTKKDYNPKCEYRILKIGKSSSLDSGRNRNLDNNTMIYPSFVNKDLIWIEHPWLLCVTNGNKSVFTSSTGCHNTGVKIETYERCINN